jgi:hypothetical protein
LSESEEQMTIVTFVLGLVLIAAGTGGLVASYDLLPTELGLLYACCGAILVSGGVVTVAVGVVVLRLEALTQMVHFAAAVEELPDEADLAAAALRADDHATSELEAALAEPEVVAEEGDAHAAEAPPVEAHATEPEPTVDEPAAEAPIEDGAVADAQSVAEREPALAAAAPATLVGHYSAGGANYKIFSDGSIEAETEGGAFRFASMADFKAYLARDRD